MTLVTLPLFISSSTQYAKQTARTRLTVREVMARTRWDWGFSPKVQWDGVCQAMFSSLGSMGEGEHMYEASWDQISHGNPVAKCWKEMQLSISLLVLLSNCMGFLVDVLPNNGFYKSKVHKTIGIPKWISMKKEIRPLRKECLPCLNIKAKFNSEKI